MSTIRNAMPQSLQEWKEYYFSNVTSPETIEAIAQEMYESIPAEEKITREECYDYICDVIFRRTFEGYKKEKQALILLRKLVSPGVVEAPKEWDNKYFIDFYLKSKNGKMIGIQLKPETFYRGNYQYKVDIKSKHNAFINDYDAVVFVLTYMKDQKTNEITLTNSQVIDRIKAAEQDEYLEATA